MELVAITIGMMLLAFMALFVILPNGWLTNVWLGLGSIVALAEYLSAFPWGQVLPPEYSMIALLCFNVLGILARERQRVVKKLRKE